MFRRFQVFRNVSPNGGDLVIAKRRLWRVEVRTGHLCGPKKIRYEQPELICDVVAVVTPEGLVFYRPTSPKPKLDISELCAEFRDVTFQAGLYTGRFNAKKKRDINEAGKKQSEALEMWNKMANNWGATPGPADRCGSPGDLP